MGLFLVNFSKIIQQLIGFGILKFLSSLGEGGGALIYWNIILGLDWL